MDTNIYVEPVIMISAQAGVTIFRFISDVVDWKNKYTYKFIPQHVVAVFNGVWIPVQAQSTVDELMTFYNDTINRRSLK